MKEKQGLLIPFLRLAEFFLKAWDKRNSRRKGDPLINRDLRTLYPHRELQQSLWEFRVKRLGMTLAVFFLGVTVALWMLAVELNREPELQDGRIRREDYRAGDKQVQMEVQMGEHRTELEMQIGARSYSQEELSLLAETFWEQLPGLILQKNEALDKVQGDLYLAEEYEGFPFQVSWYSTMPEYVERTGKVHKTVSVPVKLELQVIFYYGSMEWEHWLELTLQPDDTWTREERMLTELQDYLTESEVSSRTCDWWYLPSQWEGQDLHYHVPEQLESPSLFGLFLVAAAFVFGFAKKDLHGKYLERQRQLKADYPELLYQLTLYLGAGLTIRGSLQKIYESYEQTKGGKACLRVAFEEVGYVCRELATGVPEAKAYENWSLRTGLPEYTQLCTLLMQNLQKGSNGLLCRLREEGDNARKEYLRQCKKRSEEAQTKLLLPLVLMLVVVMLFILIPAFSMAGI